MAGDPAGRRPPGRARLGVGEARPGDLVAADADGPVLIIAAALAAPLDGLVLDWLRGTACGKAAAGLPFRPAADEEPGDLLVAAPSS